MGRGQDAGFQGELMLLAQGRASGVKFEKGQVVAERDRSVKTIHGEHTVGFDAERWSK